MDRFATLAKTLNVRSVLNGWRRMGEAALPRARSPARIRAATMPCC